jgi:hypothetical protein
MKRVYYWYKNGQKQKSQRKPYLPPTKLLQLTTAIAAADVGDDCIRPQE